MLSLLSIQIKNSVELTKHIDRIHNGLGLLEGDIRY